MDPELFLKYLLFNICPSVLERIDVETPISSILDSKEFYCGYNIRYLFVLVYNALVERHFVGVYENPEYQWERRQAIHLLALGSLTLKDIREDVLIYRKLTAIGGDLMNMKADPAIKDVSYLSTIGNEKFRSLKPEYFSIINVFFFLYCYYDRPNKDQEFLQLYQNKQCKFEILDIPELRHHFKGINNFLFSKACSDLLVSVLVEWHQDSVPKFARVVNNLIITCMSLCLMLKVSLTHNIKPAIQKTIDLIFGVREDLGDLNIMLFLVSMKGKVNHAVLSSVVDYLMELSQIQPDVFSGLSENPSDMKMITKKCQELALKNFQSNLQEHPEFDFHNNQKSI
ncbi:hypothetical protein RF11_10517 [Thelohanellus kitauei]|uniref:Uncharacterized protein n=1 Tax=Thelohanellus kitauei TaxID=669202 RepID=A0A0C2I639_THEKT|nr:hypothetical protein RF11_10517 [Thelohanellus kitauei]